MKALLEACKNREVVSVFKGSVFGKRPDTFLYPKDILQAVAEGAIAFHGSVERWENPLKLDVGMSRDELDELRIGWDVILDLDVDDFEIAKICAKQVIEALKDHGIKSYSIKFTGGDSFHIGIPFESLPPKINLIPTSKQYPELFEKIVEYIKWYCEEMLREELLSLWKVEEIAKKVNKKVEDILEKGVFSPFKIITIDVFGSRHLFRLPYSLHEKTLLVSLPLKPQSLDRFQKEDALPEKVKVEEPFLACKKRGDAEGLVVEALDWYAKRSKPVIEIEKPVVKFKKGKEIPEEFFPPCIKNILAGLPDGRKRSLFTLVTFLRNMRWSLEKIEKRVYEWNEKNKPPLKPNYIRTQLRWHFRQQRNLLPPNCGNDLFYESIGICKPDAVCAPEGKIVIKNPINYPFRLLSKGKRKKRRRKQKL